MENRVGPDGQSLYIIIRRELTLAYRVFRCIFINAMDIHNSKHGFWATLPRPILVLAPMADVTDAAFRQIIAKYGKPDVFVTEFVSVDGLCSAGRPALIRSLKYHETERPIIAQFFGDDPELFYQCAQLAQELGFDGIDINMGCPVKTVTKTGSGAALIKAPDVAKEVILATKRGAGNLPVSIKTRIGYNNIVLEEWLSHLLDTEPAVITLHLRTAKEMSLVGAHWDVMHRAVEIVHQTDTLIIGNGDVKDLDHAKQLAQETGVDGIMLGRAVFGNPWLFNRGVQHEDVSMEEKFRVMMEHAQLYEEIFERKKNFAVMQKHLRAYASGFNGAKELRKALIDIRSSEDLKPILDAFLNGTLVTSPDPQ